ncbi:hypothetical protein HF883_05790 [Cloacibacillus porcorum]|uniref:papain-like cysteine protease family protein n=1 Tax=Cloacibacillus porcorum TaxID=1197717 RepID=UPI00145983F1|nr:papain-like cysteine protease family protein [Cloacibacillus porcorum]MCC8183505.1 hypothetical protein [Cloacibacillus porcorum]MDY5389594.1 papain-like cysteine protease family protein [Cloacibacillus porcorum]NMF17740.1 hypothetical protein [Cloacibacillus porcorum]
MQKRVRRVPRPDYIIPHPESGAAYEGVADVKNSPYFKAPDFFTMESNDRGLTILTNYPTYQQTACYSCGPAAALTVLWYFGVTDYDEPELMRRMGSSGTPNERGEGGTCTAGMCRFFEEIGWRVSTSLCECRGGERLFKDAAAFRDFVIRNLRAGLPIMVENMRFGGHWRVIIGYDTMGTETTADDVLIFMDSDDVCDHCQDGYAVASAEEFFHTWRDIGALPLDQRIQQYLIAYPPDFKPREE